MVIPLILIILLSGCTPSLIGYPDKLTSNKEVIQEITIKLSPENIKLCSNNPSVDCRNDIAYNSIYGIDLAFNEFQQSLFNEDRHLSFMSSITSMGLNAVGTLYGTSALSGISGFITGSKSAFDSNLLFDKSAQGIQAQMNANRNLAKIKLLKGMKKNITDYPLTLARIDLEHYYQAGTLLNAYIALSEAASNKSLEATNQLNQVVETTYVETSTSKVLEQYIFDKNRNIVLNNIRTLDAWLVSNKVDMHSASFINAQGDNFEKLRSKAIGDLNIK